MVSFDIETKTRWFVKVVVTPESSEKLATREDGNAVKLRSPY